MFSLHEPIDEAMRSALGSYDDATAALLARRGVTSHEEAEAFLAPSYDLHLGDPLQITDMEKAARRIAAALDSGERIAVWSDYDCDGIPGGVVLHDFLKKAGANFTNYIPHRHLEGYGLNADGIRSLAKDGVTLIVTVDSGIVDHEPVTVANGLGIDVIITDHHLPADTLPDAYAVVDPKRADETYPFRDFCGAGLAWRLACAVLAVGFKGRESIPVGWEKWLLDMAALGTIADMVPLTGENRVIASYGLLVMRKSRRIGLQQLCAVARAKQVLLTEDDVAFLIAPRVNAASRMGDPREAFELFSTSDQDRAVELAKGLERINRSRRSLGAAITRAARERLAERSASGTVPDVIVMGDPKWRPGLLGLVANTLAQEYDRPVFLWGREGGVGAKGSCRSARGISLVELMRAAEEGTFDEFGGHAASGGFTAADHAIFALEERLCAALALLPEPDAEASAPHADFDLPADLRAELKRTQRLAPFGIANPRPTYRTQGAHIASIAWFGAGGEHLRLSLIPAEAAQPVEAICFFAKRELGSACEKLELNGTCTVLATLERDTFTKGQPVRMRIVALAR